MKQKSINQFMKHIWVRRKYKDRLFQRVFRDKADLLTLYNALNHTDYQNPDDLEITTLDDVIYLSMKNDISFIISSTLNLYEHQSTYNPNMPIRGLMYFARTYEGYIKQHEENIYGHSLVRLPMPQYVFFYNGCEDRPDEEILRLSDSFLSTSAHAKPCLECTARMLNINYGHNQTLLNTCKRLHDYSYFIEQINLRISSKKSLKESIRESIDYCIEHDILTDILIKQKSEVFHMLLTEFDEKSYTKAIKKEGYTEGYTDGKQEGRLEGRQEEKNIINQLTMLLAEVGRTDDIIKAAKDPDYQDALMKEFHLE